MVRRTHGELRIIDAYRSGSDAYCVMQNPQLAHILASLVAGQPFLAAGFRCDVAVHRHGHLQRDVRTHRSNRARKGFDDRSSAFVVCDFDGDAPTTKEADAAAICFWIRIQRSDYNACDARFRDRIRAWRRSSKMSAWLERNIECRSARPVTGHAKRMHFGMRLARTVMIALACDLAIAHDNRTDSRIRRCIAGTALGELVRAFEVKTIQRPHAARIYSPL